MEQIVYRGRKFTIEWYFNKSGKSQPLDYYLSLDEAQQIRFVALVKRMGDFGSIIDKTKFRNEGDKIYAFKPKPDRYLCFFVSGRKIIITNAFIKKQDRLPPEEKRRALEIKADYEIRLREGVYYE